jgi:hypothetical protein
VNFIFDQCYVSIQQRVGSIFQRNMRRKKKSVLLNCRCVCETLDTTQDIAATLYLVLSLNNARPLLGSKRKIKEGAPDFTQ